MPKAADGPASGGWKRGVAAAAGGVLIGGLAVALYYGVRVPSREETEAIVHNYILDHGEILPTAMERMQQRQANQAALRNRAALERPFHGAWAGAADGDVVMVYFFDYACGYCRQSDPFIERLLREDRRLKVVWREYPVLGPDSEQASIASLAAARAGRFRQFHGALSAAGRPTPAAIAAAQAATGVAPATLTDEFRRELTGNLQLGRAIGGTGTPIFVIGGRVLHGAGGGYEGLRDAIAEARRAR